MRASAAVAADLMAVDGSVILQFRFGVPQRKREIAREGETEQEIAALETLLWFGCITEQRLIL